MVFSYLILLSIRYLFSVLLCKESKVKLSRSRVEYPPPEILVPGCGRSDSPPRQRQLTGRRVYPSLLLDSVGSGKTYRETFETERG